MIFGFFTLIVGLIISGVAAYYSIVGLTAIFSTAVVPIIIMGAALEIGKITAALWLKLNWAKAKWTYKLYLVPAVAVLMLLTSMGIFGFLSKAHSDQNLVSGDVTSKISIYDEKIKTERENIEVARRALAQLDAQVDQRLSRGTTEQGAERAAQMRRQQQAERTRLQRDITISQTNIAKLQDERAPIAAEIRRVEAEVGPIKYVAALLYGDNPDINLLERAVRWMIIIIVAVFDPLALVLILAAQQSLRWAQDNRTQKKTFNHSENIAEQPITETVKQDPEIKITPETHSYLFGDKSFYQKPEGWVSGPPIVATVEPSQTNTVQEEPVPVEKKIKKLRSKIKEQVEESNKPDAWVADVGEKPTAKELAEIASDQKTQEFVTASTQRLYKVLVGDYLEVNGKTIHKRVLADLYPDVDADIKLRAKGIKVGNPSESTFGTEFPVEPTKGQIFLSVKSLPSKLYKFNGDRWIGVDKSIADSYTYNTEYLEYLVQQINSGRITVDDLTAKEQEQVEEYLKNVKSNNNAA